MSALSHKAPSAVDPIASVRRTLLTRLLPAAVLITLGLAWLRLQGEKAGFYSTSVGAGLMVILTISLLAILVWWTTRVLNRAESELAVAEHALRTSEQRARLVIESAYDAFIAMNAEGVIIDWNTEAEKIFGFSSSQAIGRKLSETIIPEQYRERHREGLKHFLKTGEGPLLGKRLEITALRADNSEFPVVLAISPVRWADTWIFNAFLHEIRDREVMDAAESAAPPVSEAPIASGLRIVLVEDHLRTGATLARLLESWGYSVQQADSLAQGRQLIRSQSFDLLLTDLDLPDGEGSDLMREIRETSPATLGIAITGFDTPASAAASTEAGFSLHFTKPIATEKLKTAIEEIAKTQRGTRGQSSEDRGQ
jgi:PAS domain S-box-containing protein